MSSSNGLGSRIKAGLFGSGKITSEQKLRAQIDNLTTQAKELNTTGIMLTRRADDFSTRSANTVAPGSKPPHRDLLFQRNKNAAGPSQYEEQIAAHKALTTDFKQFKSDAADYGRRMNRFDASVSALKKKHVRPDKTMGSTEHELEGLENALFNLKTQRADLDKKITNVHLPHPK